MVEGGWRRGWRGGDNHLYFVIQRRGEVDREPPQLSIEVKMSAAPLPHYGPL